LKRIAVYPGSFDPVTVGHLDVIQRAAKLFDELIVLVSKNILKSGESFTPQERASMITRVTKDLPTVRVDISDGLLVDYVKDVHAIAIVKGLRAVSDFEYEFQMALANQKLYGEAETIFLTTCTENMYLSSSVVKQIAAFNGNIRHFVPDVLHDEIMHRLSKEYRHEN
jgi:pantetheine-phosphate adenylyltransferase